MGFQDAVRTCFRKYATFSGTARRPEFWWFALFCFLGSGVMAIIDAALFGADSSPLGALFGLVTILPILAVGTRRLHDIGRSGWWQLLYLVPLIGALVLLWFFTRPSEGNVG